MEEKIKSLEKSISQKDMPKNWIESIKLNIKEELEESNLPFFVELVNWKHMRPSFREMIKKDLTPIT